MDDSHGSHPVSADAGEDPHDEWAPGRADPEAPDDVVPGRIDDEPEIESPGGSEPPTEEDGWHPV
ncbi:hypothetical protein [Phytoactinopolyspora endophytica]|uniref:hypothetical protein n=1 Tax=Phytoactinopolyspora endophytica TaxID=1642495 RepID=UPI00101CAD33|nr:hypothetical protein [Phytoactinopolyspora endophytica]